MPIINNMNIMNNTPMQMMNPNMISNMIPRDNLMNINPYSNNSTISNKNFNEQMTATGITTKDQQKHIINSLIS
jgi:hypothetical protein